MGASLFRADRRKELADRRALWPTHHVHDMTGDIASYRHDMQFLHGSLTERFFNLLCFYLLYLSFQVTCL